MQTLNVSENVRPDFDEFLEASAFYNDRHFDAMKESEFAGCYHCCKIFPADSIKEWVRSTRKEGEYDCALCPNCGIDAVLPDSKVVLSTSFLEEMSKYWFNYNVIPEASFASYDLTSPTGK